MTARPGWLPKKWTRTTLKMSVVITGVSVLIALIVGLIWNRGAAVDVAATLWLGGVSSVLATDYRRDTPRYAGPPKLRA